MKKMISFKNLILAIMLFYVFGICGACALSECKPEIGKQLIQSEEYSTENNLGNGIINKEKFTVIKYVYDGRLNENPYEYITTKIENTYLKDSDRTIIGISKLNQNFRYTNEMKLSECLSVSKGEISNNNTYNFVTNIRISNKTHNLGCGSAKVKFSHMGVTVDKKVYEISCDAQGNVKF